MRMTDELGKYEPGQIEQKWYDCWESHGVFHDEPDDTKKHTALCFHLRM